MLVDLRSSSVLYRDFYGSQNQPDLRTFELFGLTEGDVLVVLCHYIR